MDGGSQASSGDETKPARIDALADEDTARVVAEDPDAAPLLTDEQLAGMRLLRPTDIAATRHLLGLSQTEFAAWFGISPGTLRNWEQGRHVPGARADVGDRARPGGGPPGARVRACLGKEANRVWSPRISAVRWRTRRA